MQIILHNSKRIIISNKHLLLVYLFRKKDIDIGILSEIWLKPDSNFKFVKIISIVHSSQIFEASESSH